MIKHQKGIGLIEILVSLFILAIGVLGFSALQLKAVQASSEAMTKLQAMNLGRDLAERIRANPTAYTLYATKLNAETQVTTATSCVQNSTSIPCATANDLATYDAAEVIKGAQNLGMKIAMPNCQVVSSGQNRRCIYIAWGDSKPLDSTTDANACTKNGSYQLQSKCIVMEIY